MAQDELLTVKPEIVDLRAKQAALSDTVQHLDTQRKTIADRYRSKELDAIEQAFVKVVKKAVEATMEKQQAELENKLKRAEHQIAKLTADKASLEKQWTKQFVATKTTVTCCSR